MSLEDLAKREAISASEPMTIDRYQDLAAKTRDQRRTGSDAILYADMSIMGEIGEVVELVKKWWFHGASFTDTLPQMIDEIGDVLWSCAEWATVRDARLRNLVGCDSFGALQGLSGAPDRASTLLLCLTHKWGAAGVLDALAKLCNHWQIDLESCARKNVAKLKARYPGGFVAGGGVRVEEPACAANWARHYFEEGHE